VKILTGGRLARPTREARMLFLLFDHSCFEFVSDFDIRISDLAKALVRSWWK
jgi:hypothetical protein